MKWLCRGGMLACSGLYVAAFFHDLFQCVPVQKEYDLKMPGHCLPNGTAGSVTGIFNVISDFYIFVIPLGFVWSLHVPTRKKSHLMTLFGTGIL